MQFEASDGLSLCALHSAYTSKAGQTSEVAEAAYISFAVVCDLLCSFLNRLPFCATACICSFFRNKKSFFAEVVPLAPYVGAAIREFVPLAKSTCNSWSLTRFYDRFVSSEHVFLGWMLCKISRCTFLSGTWRKVTFIGRLSREKIS